MELETSKANAEGEAMHEECYLTKMNGKQASPEWREIAERASHEEDPHKLRLLISELCDLLEKRTRQT